MYLPDDIFNGDETAVFSKPCQCKDSSESLRKLVVGRTQKKGYVDVLRKHEKRKEGFSRGWFLSKTAIVHCEWIECLRFYGIRLHFQQETVDDEENFYLLARKME